MIKNWTCDICGKEFAIQDEQYEKVAITILNPSDLKPCEKEDEEDDDFFYSETCRKCRIELSNTIFNKLNELGGIEF